MAYDAPKLGGYQFQNPPERMDVFWEAIQQNHELADGGYRQRILGYRLRATLTWGRNWITNQDLTGLNSVAQDSSATLSFLPRPDTFPSAIPADHAHEVIWTNKMEFTHHEGHFGYYGGSIELVSFTPTSTIGEPLR